MFGLFSLRPLFRHLVFAGGIALTVFFGAAATTPASDSIAAPSQCTVTHSSGSSSLVCVPGVAPTTAGAPSEQDLTFVNHAGGPGIAGLL
jgi:hypothetical protein